jgi:UDP-N-acetylglucosamine diphosphorylase/glucosamine-1-phosphate N-acetyltransferase
MVLILWITTQLNHSMNYILFDDERFHQFLPLTHTRPTAELRCGIMTMRERWEHILKQKISHKTEKFLQEKYPFVTKENNIFINSALFPSDELIKNIEQLKEGECLIKDNILLCASLQASEAVNFDIQKTFDTSNKISFTQQVQTLDHLWDIFSLNDMAIRADYKRLTSQRKSEPLSSTNTVLGNDLFIEEGAKIECSMINTTSGPVYIGRHAEIMEGCMIRGPFAIGNHGVLKMGAKIYGATTIGDGCKVGGEVNNSVFYANSSKAHDGFIGNAVIGEWCNIGADTNNSNLKNNYEEVKLWSEYQKSFVKTGLQFCGLVMGDHSKIGINTMLNTGTVIGVSCNVYGAGFPRNFIPSFSWGSANGFMEYQLSKAVSTAIRVFARRDLEFDDIENNIMAEVFSRTSDQRKY